MNILRFAFAGALFLATTTSAVVAQAAEFITIQLKDGPVVVELNDKVAPKHVERIKALATAGEYDNVAFHRVIEGFMAQTGDVQYGDMSAGF
ncbi:peptidylprolyl isomerase, partial [Shinella sp.]